jgi:mannitol/fructose-specific phosphotransferase system IIA component (Ntr-type)
VELADVFRPEAILVGLEHRTRQGAVTDLVRQLATLGHVPPEEEAGVVRGILARETTRINGIAYPHGRFSFVNKFIGAVGLDTRGLPFDAVDGDPVYAIFLLLGPQERRDQLYEVLGRVTAMGKDKTLRLQLRSCETAEMVHQFLQTMDRR